MTRQLLSFERVVEHLSGRAALIAGAAQKAPQPEIYGLDVSNCERRSLYPSVDQGDVEDPIAQQ